MLALVAACATERARPDGEPVAGVHPPGILDQASEDFHGRELARRGYDLALCATCHGDDFRGGKAGVACTTCHEDGPTACTTCHGAGPTSGNHPVHLADAKLGCAECHTVPAAWNSPGHIGSVEVTFGALASKTPASFVDGSCRVYCHGVQAPRWDATPVKACDRCHGNPPPTHAQARCASCHPPSAPHVDGTLQVGSACDSCHGSAGNPAPPNDLDGNVATTALGVGAHRAHVTAASGISAPIACAACHVVPATVDAPGHIDTPLPAEVVPSLGWDRNTGTCATAWCHGPARPVWTTSGGAACGSCHGIPPAGHPPGTTINNCASCHPAGFVKHVDGVVDVL